MQFPGKLTEQDLKDVQRIVRSKSYWARLALRNWYGIALLVAVTWGTIAGLLGQTKPNWPALGIVWAVIAGIFGWSFYRAKQGQMRALAKFNAASADQISLANDGVKMNGPNGATRFLPWINFKGWREGSRTVLLDQTQENQFVILPIAQLSEIERQQLRGLLRSQIPSARSST